jgi:hypothetical protein
MKFNLIKLALLFVVLTALLGISQKHPAHAVGVTPAIKADPNPMIAPTITADPNPVVIPKGQTQGTTTLSWDGGTDHPYAELWVQVDANDETFIVESGKNTRQVTIELGKTYLFKVSDANVTLASVTVTAKQQETPPPTGGVDPRDKIETSRDKAKVDKILKPSKPHKSFKHLPIKPPARELIRLSLLGGPAGNDFEYICGTEEVLVGVRGYSGAWIDNVQAVCARAKDHLEAAVPEGSVFGGAANQINNFAYCPGQGIAARLVVSETENRSALGSIFFGCQDFATKQQSGTSRTMQGGDPLATAIGISQSCPANTVAVGIRGRAGTYLNALGLVCSTRP